MIPLIPIQPQNNLKVVNFALSVKQTRALDALENPLIDELLFGGGAGGGKSVLGCYWIMKMCLRYPGTRWVIGRSSLKTLKDTTLKTLWWVFGQRRIVINKDYRYNDNSSIIVFSNGSEILLKDLKLYPGKDPDFNELGSLEITGAFVDECNQIVKKAWEILKSRIRYRLDEYGLTPTILGTCNPDKNWVYINFYFPSTVKELKQGRAFIQSLVDDNPKISKHYKNNLMTLDDQASKERLLHGNWDYDNDPAALCTFDAIRDMFYDTVAGDFSDTFISADLAMQGRDRFVAGLWHGLVCDIRIDKKKATGKEIEQDLTEIINFGNVGRSRVVADSDGLGNYLESYLNGIKEFHGNATAVNDVEYANIKAECGFKLAELINKRQIKIICTPEQRERITQEVGVLKRDKIDGDDQRKRIIKKEVQREILGNSPDYLDMLIMRMFFEVKTEIYGYAG